MREFAARDQNEIIFIERAFTKDSIAANLFKHLKVFQVADVRAQKRKSAQASTSQAKSHPPAHADGASGAAGSSATPTLKTKDPRKNARLNKQASAEQQQKAGGKMSKNANIDKLVNESMLNKGQKGGAGAAASILDATQATQQTFAEDQLDMQKQVIQNKRLEKAYRKSFALSNPFPTFSFYGYNDAHDGMVEVNKRPRLTLYGEINEQELFVSTQKKEDQQLVLDEQERVQMEQAVTNVIEEKAHIESYNRFKDLQAQYSQPFVYFRE